jgi:hypothetical protein
MVNLQRQWMTCCLLFTILAAGCGGDELELVPVAGKLTFKGEPVGKAHIGFIRDSMNAKVEGPGPAAIATTAEDGTFTLKTNEAEGAVPGTYRVTVNKTTRVDMDIPNPLPKGYVNDTAYMMAHGLVAEPLLPLQYSSITSTPLTFEVTSDSKGNNFEVKLEGEAPPHKQAPKPLAPEFMPPAPAQ